MRAIDADEITAFLQLERNGKEVESLDEFPTIEPEQSRIEKELHGLTPEQQYIFLRELMYEKAAAWNCTALYVIAWLKGEED